MADKGYIYKCELCGATSIHKKKNLMEDLVSYIKRNLKRDGIIYVRKPLVI